MAQVRVATDVDDRIYREMLKLRVRGDATKRLLFPLARGEGGRLDLVLFIEEHELGPRQAAHLLQNRLGKREVRLGQRANHSSEVVFLLATRG